MKAEENCAATLSKVWSRCRCFLPLLLAAVACVGCVRERSPITGRPQAYGLSWNQELQMGRKADPQILQEYGLIENPGLQRYVEQVGLRVLRHSDLREPSTPAIYQKTPIQFKVLDSPVVNAFAIPGYVYVTRGLLAHVDNEAQLAVVLGHEIAHIAARHIGEQALKQQLSQAGLFAGAIVGAQVLENPSLTSQLLGLGSAGVQLLNRKFSRDDEREADRLGILYALAAGYRASEAARFFNALERIQQKEGLAMPNWLSTHPDPGQREQTILELAARYQPENAILVVGAEEFLNQIEGMVLGQDPREGFVADNVFYHPQLRFKFPVSAEWNLKNKRAAVLMSSPQNSALVTFTLQPAESPRAAATRFVRSQGIEVFEAKPTTVNGFEAFAIFGQADTQQGPIEVFSYFIRGDDHTFQFLGLAPPGASAQAQSTLQRIASGFSRLTDPQILNVRPTVAAVVKIERPAPFSSFVPTGPVGGLTLEELAIMNQVQLHQIMPAGALLKMPRSLFR